MGVNILRAETYLQYSGIGGTDRGPSIHFPTSAFGSYMRFEEITDKHVIVYSPRIDRRIPFRHSEASTPYGHRDKFGRLGSTSQRYPTNTYRGSAGGQRNHAGRT